MRALVLREIGMLEIEERAVPEPADDEVLIRIVATGICGSDIHGYTGENGRRFPGQVMGHESVGRVAGLGVGVPPESFPLDQVVTFNPVVIPAADGAAYGGREQHHPAKLVIGVEPSRPASFADYIVVPARNVVPLPDGVPIAHGALVEPLAVAVHAVRRTIQPDARRALVVGGGPIGQSTVLALRSHGISDVIVSEVDRSRRELCERLGATTVDPSAAPLLDQLAVRGGPVDIAFDAVGITPTLAGALDATALGGHVCLVGMGAPRIDLAAYSVSTQERTIVGSFTYSAQDFIDAAALIGADHTTAAALISREVAPDEADDAFRRLGAGDAPPGKVLVRFDR